MRVGSTPVDDESRSILGTPNGARIHLECKPFDDTMR